MNQPQRWVFLCSSLQGRCRSGGAGQRQVWGTDGVFAWNSCQHRTAGGCFQGEQRRHGFPHLIVCYSCRCIDFIGFHCVLAFSCVQEKGTNCWNSGVVLKSIDTYDAAELNKALLCDVSSKPVSFEIFPPPSLPPGKGRQRQCQPAPSAAGVPGRHPGHSRCRRLHQVWEIPDRRDGWVDHRDWTVTLVGSSMSRLFYMIAAYQSYKL